MGVGVGLEQQELDVRPHEGEDEDERRRRAPRVGVGAILRLRPLGAPQLVDTVEVGHVQQGVLEVEGAALPRLQPEDTAARVAPGEGEGEGESES